MRRVKAKPTRMLKYRGRYSDLKNEGFKFQKLYARNYMVWHREVGESYVWFWRAGRDVEIEDNYGMSGGLAEFILNNGELETVPGNKVFPEFKRMRCVIDFESASVVTYDGKHNSLAYFILEDDESPELPEEAKSKLIAGLTYKTFHDRFKVVCFTPEFVEYIRKLFKEGKLEIEVQK